MFQSLVLTQLLESLRVVRKSDRIKTIKNNDDNETIFFFLMYKIQVMYESLWGFFVEGVK